MSTTQLQNAPIAPIRPLDPATISQLRSSVNITSLPNTLSEVLQNALDAAATTITISLNLPRSSLTITDNGHGIPPSDLAIIGT
ncbi:hypothetical protein BJ508DRAFT_219171, partial [Ascobolus immersus RN42]